LKKYIISCFAVILFLSTEAQQEKRINIDSIRKDYYATQLKRIKDSAEYIFEGIVRKKDHYMRPWKNGSEFNTTSTIVEITKVFRGNLRIGTVEIVNYADSRMIGNTKIRGSYKLNSGDTMKEIFFCNSSNIYPYDPKYNIDTVDNKTILNPFCSLGSLKSDPNDLYFNGISNKRLTKGEFYRFFGSFPNATMPILTKEDTTVLIIPSNHIAIPSKPKTYTTAEMDSLREISAKKLYENNKVNKSTNSK